MSNVKDALDSLPSIFNKTTRNEALDIVTQGLEEFKNEGWKRNPKISNFSAAKMVDGFGTALIIAGGGDEEFATPLIERFEKTFAWNVRLQRFLTNLDKDDPIPELPNWEKCAGATLPLWNDPKSRQDFTNIVMRQLITNTKAIGDLKKATHLTIPIVKDAANGLLASCFLIGLIKGLLYCNPNTLPKTFSSNTGNTLDVADTMVKLDRLFVKSANPENDSNVIVHNAMNAVK